MAFFFQLTIEAHGTPSSVGFSTLGIQIARSSFFSTPFFAQTKAFWIEAKGIFFLSRQLDRHQHAVQLNISGWISSLTFLLYTQIASLNGVLF